MGRDPADRRRTFLGAAVDQSGLAGRGGRIYSGRTRILPQGCGGDLTLVVSSVMSNTAAVNLIAPVVMGLSGIDHAPLLLICGLRLYALDAASVSTPPNAMAYGFRSILRHRRVQRARYDKDPASR